MYTLKSHLIFFILFTLLLQASCQQATDNQQNQGIKTGSNRYSIGEEQAIVNLDQITLPDGFEISVWAAAVPNARSLSRSPEGVVFVGSRQEDKVYAVLDEDKDGKADIKYILAEGLRMPNGVAFRDGDLYVAEVSRILKFPDILDHLDDPSYEVIYDAYPTEGHHGWKYIAFGPDGFLYVPVGAPCNTCLSQDEVYASITRIDVLSPNPSPEIIAHGVRNTVGFDWHPKTGSLWFTDNGRDMMGDDIPDCELNVLKAPGQHFGYPFWHAGTVKDPEFGSKGKQASAYEQPIAHLGAHVAPLGIHFYTETKFPEKYHNQAFVARHGSWNRSQKAGYDVILVNTHEEDQAAGTQPFASGWLDQASQEVWGRPVDVMTLPDGSLLISDDMADCIYRIYYTGN